MLLPLRLFNVADPFLTGLLSFQLCQLVFQICDGFFSMAYLLLNFALLLFTFPFGFQIAVIRDLSEPLLDVLATSWKLPLILSFVWFSYFSFFPWVLVKLGFRVLGLSPLYPGHDNSGSAQFGSGSVQTHYPQFDEVAFCSLICTSFTTCFTFGTAEAILSASARLDCELTSPVSVTTPFLTSYLTLL